MAYNKTGLTLPNVAQADRTKKFEYTSEVNSLAGIKASGYFTPDVDDYDDLANKIEVGDFIQIKGIDGSDMIWVESLDPIVTVSVSDSEDIALAQGSVLVGDANGKAAAVDLSASGKFLVGDGTTASPKDLEPTDMALTQGNMVIGDGSGIGAELDLTPSGAVPMGNGTDVVATNVFAGYPVFMGTVTWSGGGTTLAHTVTGVLDTDIVMALWQAAPTEASDIGLAVATADTITFTASSANTSNDGVVGYVVFRAPAAAS